MELTAEVIKQYHLDILKCATLEEKQKMFLSQVKNNKDFAVLQHRKMWIWIAQQYAKGRKTEVANLKREYIKEKFFNVDMYSNCFCCEYAHNNSFLHMCSYCPLVWTNEYCCETDESEYNLISDIYVKYEYLSENIKYFPKKYGTKKFRRKLEMLKRRLVKVAYKISQLPERKEVYEN